MAEIVVNGNVINTTEAEHTYRDASSSEFIYINTYGDLNVDQKDELFNLGVFIQEYISDHTYMCNYKNSDLESIRQLSFIRAANVFEPVLKTDIALKNDIAARRDQTYFKVEVEIHAGAPQTLQQLAEEISRVTGVSVDQMKIGNGRVELTVHRDNIPQLEAIDSVNHIEEFQPITMHNEYARGVLAQDWDYSSFGEWRHSNTFKGRNERVVVCDTGTDKTHPALVNKIDATYSLWVDDVTQHKDTNGHGTHVAGSVAEGVATEAKLVCINMWDPNADNGRGGKGTNVTTDFNYLFGHPYDKYGARVHTNSWGHSWSDNQTKQEGYSTTAGVIDNICREKPDFVVCFSAGNDGGRNNWQGEMASHNAAKNVITVGNSVSLRPNDNGPYNLNCVSPDAKRMCPGSSTGPALPEVYPGGYSGGRIKPDVVCPGTAILSALSKDKSEADRANSEYWNGKYWGPDYCFLYGTSMSTPHVAGCCAVIREALRAPELFNMTRPTSSLVKALLINGTIDLKGHRYKTAEKEARDGTDFIGPAPNGIQGFGRVDLTNSLQNVVLGCPDKQTPGFGYTDNGDWNPSYWPRSLSYGETWTSNWIPRKHKVICVTMAYPDEAGKATANVVNLMVTCGGQWRYGNQGDSQQYHDAINNVEKVVWENPPGDQFQIQVYARSFTRGRRNPDGTDIRQSFACAWMCHT